MSEIAMLIGGPKHGELLAEDLDRQLEEAKERSGLPERPDRRSVNRLAVEMTENTLVVPRSA